jgi:acetyl esterase/lipase
MKQLLLLFIYSNFFIMSFSQTVIPLYKDSIPNSKASIDKETSKMEGEDKILIISNVSRPSLTAYLPPKEIANGTAVIICPGGSYAVLAASHEGSDVAKKFNEMGVAAFVLKYRLPDDTIMINKEIGPLQDAQQAIKLVRENATGWNINLSKIGIMGFSAGGHLASTAGTHFMHAVIENKNNINLRPDFLILIYPVISFTDAIGHIGSRENLLGENPSEKKIKEYSNELQVTVQTPKTFLVHAENDDVVNVKNSINFFEALQQNHVLAELHVYPKGGHGFGMNNPTTKDKWMERLQNWMDSNGWLKK